MAYYKPSSPTWSSVIKDLENYSISNTPVTKNNVSMHAGGVEMLRVAKDGFYVRGVRVPADEKEASTVYEAFKAFLMWAELHRK